MNLSWVDLIGSKNIPSKRAAKVILFLTSKQIFSLFF